MVLKKSFRLKKKRNFQKVKSKGKFYDTPLFSVLFLENQEKAPKFGFIVSKKIDKAAVTRNKIRRQLSEAVKSLLPELRTDIFVLVLVKKRIKKASFQEIKDNLLKVNPIFRKELMQ